MENSTIIIKKPSEKSFSIVFSIIFFLVALFFLNKSYFICINFLVISFLTLMIGLFKPHYLIQINLIWFKLGIFLGGIISPVIIGIIYFILVFPTGVILKLFNKDPILKNTGKNKPTYWITRKTPIYPFKNQF